MEVSKTTAPGDPLKPEPKTKPKPSTPNPKSKTLDGGLGDRDIQGLGFRILGLGIQGATGGLSGPVRILEAGLVSKSSHMHPKGSMYLIIRYLGLGY